MQRTVGFEGWILIQKSQLCHQVKILRPEWDIIYSDPLHNTGHRAFSVIPVPSS